MKFRKGDRVIWRPKPGSDWDYPSKYWNNVPPVGTVGTVKRDHEEDGYVTVRWEHKGCIVDSFPPEYLEPQVEIPWIYPDGSEEWKERDEIIAELRFLNNTEVFDAGSEISIKLTRVLDSTLGFYAWKYGRYGCLRDEDIKLLAYIPYTKPNPPEKPQDCPFCGSEMEELRSADIWWLFECNNKECCFCSPYRETKADAVKALNSVKVVKE